MDISNKEPSEAESLGHNLPTPSEPIASQNPFEASSLFSCVECGARLVVPQALYFHEKYARECIGCERPISIEMIHTDEGVHVVELLGCDYQGAVESFEDIGSLPLGARDRTLVDVEPSEFEGEDFIQELQGSWEVIVRSGETIHFKYFSAVRKAIEEGRIVSNDEIIPSDGRHYRVQSYPGTADLFGNPFLRADARFSLQPGERNSRPKWVAPRKTFGRIVYAVVLVAFAAVTPSLYQIWNVYRAQTFLQSLVAHEAVVSSSQALEKLLQAKELFRQGSVEDLQRASRGFLVALAAKPTDIDALVGLSETWSELGHQTSDRALLEKSEELIWNARALNGEAGDISRARARLLWRQGKREPAMNLLETHLVDHPNDAEAHTLLAKIALESDDLVKAALHLDWSLRLDPSNASYLSALASLLERQGKFLEAAEYVKRLLSTSGDGSVHLETLIRLYRQAGDLDAAESLLRSAVARPESKEGVRAALVMLVAEQKRADATVQEALAYFSAFPSGDHHAEIDGLYRKALELTAVATPELAGETPRYAEPRRLSRRSIRRR